MKSAITSPARAEDTGLNQKSGMRVEGSKVFLAEGKDHRVAGIVLLSFTDATRDGFLAMNELPVPADSVYLANMAVDKAFRRCAALCHAY